MDSKLLVQNISMVKRDNSTFFSKNLYPSTSNDEVSKSTGEASQISISDNKKNDIVPPNIIN